MVERPVTTTAGGPDPYRTLVSFDLAGREGRVYWTHPACISSARHLLDEDMRYECDLARLAQLADPEYAPLTHYVVHPTLGADDPVLGPHNPLAGVKTEDILQVFTEAEREPLPHDDTEGRTEIRVFACVLLPWERMQADLASGSPSVVVEGLSVQIIHPYESIESALWRWRARMFPSRREGPITAYPWQGEDDDEEPNAEAPS